MRIGGSAGEGRLASASPVPPVISHKQIYANPIIQRSNPVMVTDDFPVAVEIQDRWCARACGIESAGHRNPVFYRDYVIHSPIWSGSPIIPRIKDGLKDRRNIKCGIIQLLCHGLILSHRSFLMGQGKKAQGPHVLESLIANDKLIPHLASGRARPFL